MVRREHQPEAIACESRKYMEMNVEDFLACGDSICQKEIDTFTPDHAVPENSSHAMRHSEDLRTLFCFQIGQISCVSVRND